MKNQRHYREAQLSAIVDNSDDAIISISKNGIIETWNSGAETLYGYDRQEAIGRDIDLIFPDDIKESEKTLLQRISQGESVNRYQTKRRNKSGQLLDISLTISALTDSDDNIIGYFIIEHDISTIKHTQNEILRLTSLSQLQNRRLNDIISNVPGAVFEGVGDLIENGTQKLTFISDYAEKMFGYSIDEWMSEPDMWRKVLHPEDWDQAVAESIGLLQKNKPGIIRYRAVTKDKRTLHIESHLAFELNENTNEVRSHGVMMDVSKQVLAEEARLEVVQELRRSNEELEQFAYVASHDLQEPLRMVTSYLQLIEKRYKDKLDEDGHTFIDFAVDGATRMKQLITDLLVYSRLQRNDTPFEEVDFNGAVSSALHNLKLNIEENDAIIVHDALPSLYGNETQLIQLFQNLIGNALKFRGEDPPHIIISARKEKQKWIFSVSDNGIGIPKEQNERIFIIFQRLHTRDNYGGTGIGLAMCKKIVDKHNGEIWLESDVEQGTNFYFSIPINNKRRQFYGGN